MVAGGGTGPQKLVSVAWREKGLVGRWTHPKPQKFGMLIGHSEKVLDRPTPKTNVVQGEQRKASLLLLAGCSEPALGQCTGLSSPWVPWPWQSRGWWPSGGSVSLSVPPGEHTGLFMDLCGPRSHMTNGSVGSHIRVSQRGFRGWSVAKKKQSYPGHHLAAALRSPRMAL